MPSQLADDASLLLRGLFPHHHRVRFTVSGTEAAQLSVRLARAYTSRDRVLRLSGHYHGHLDEFLDRADAGTLRSSEGIVHGTEAQAGRAWPSLDDVVATINVHHRELAAVILEPFPVNGGGVAPASGGLEVIRELCTAHEIVLIFDEVITGFRAGLGGYQRLAGVKPDVTMVGKVLGGGAIPVGGVLASERLFALCAEHRVVHGGTFNGSPAAMAAVRATITMLADETGQFAMSSLQRAGRELMASLAAAVDRFGLPFDVRGLPGAILVVPADASVANVRRFRSALWGERVLTAPPARLYVTAGMRSEDIEEISARVVRAMRRYAETGSTFGGES